MTREAASSASEHGGVRILLNGETVEVPEGLTVAELLEHLNFPPTRVAVERNRAVVRKAEHDHTAVEAGDSIEVVTFVGGG